MKNRTIPTLSILGLLAVVLVFGFAGTPVSESLPRKNQTWLQQHKEAAKTTVLLNNTANLVPLQNLEQKMASVNLGFQHAAVFDSLLNKYALVTSFSGLGIATDSAFNSLNDDLKFFGTVIVQVPATRLQEPVVRNFISSVQRDRKVVVAAFGKPSFLLFAEEITAPLVWSEKETSAAADFAAQLIFGGVPATGELDKAYSTRYPKGAGAKTAAIRLKYTVPEEVGIQTANLLAPIDAIAAEMVREQAAPGAVVLVAKDGKVIFNKAYGSHTYDQSQPTTINDIFDLASVTKVSATTMAVM
ncbi:MAG: serine hydrolase, partial [Rufibacter sp.]